MGTMDHVGTTNDTYTFVRKCLVNIITIHMDCQQEATAEDHTSREVADAKEPVALSLR